MKKLEDGLRREDLWLSAFFHSESSAWHVGGAQRVFGVSEWPPLVLSMVKKLSGGREGIWTEGSSGPSGAHAELGCHRQRSESSALLKGMQVTELLMNKAGTQTPGLSDLNWYTLSPHWNTHDWLCEALKASCVESTGPSFTARLHVVLTVPPEVAPVPHPSYKQRSRNQRFTQFLERSEDKCVCVYISPGFPRQMEVKCLLVH